ncbi:NAD(P)H-dependent glycerol-3-phosphate dehydrogenase [Opitutus sp. ER46]|uniref:NAD(P)H-dependent glycerol-3-phosphate dehydrogenase n=1 Tax=Opitutus sp. ER46 TaxID=2161864 RepID=UPI000D2F5638|nr:NAD(P)H-dependent glycerol-3-phosphate dehydrogenase [Opitutus sp. ER46]PTX91590.1 glycerol-3-phosphate dehydrogenase [Opitutus sp. ER46]
MNFVVLGAGAWGTGFALHLLRAGQRVVLVPRRPEQAGVMTASRENADYLPGMPLPDEIDITADLGRALRDADAVLLACPAQALRETARRASAAAPADARIQLVLSLAKGLELGTHRRPSEVIAEAWPGITVGSLAGPTNALGVARGDPSAMVLATARSHAAVEAVQAAISGPTLRAYTSDDLAGVEFGGCLKNIYAIAAGCCDGLRLGDNTKAALLTRALTEMVRVGVSLGARAETFYGLSGFGDLVATCYGSWSRNREFGQRVGEGHAAADLIAHRRTVVEGYKTAEAFGELCLERGIDAPILQQVRAVLTDGRRPADAISALMTRELKPEHTAP